MYFQYDSAGTPVGFVYNDIQYLYITNQNGDVIGLADAKGTPLVEYVYDEWGKLLEIYTAEEGNEEQLALAQANPLRYRGYYYDTETGYYYLQSRYYDPELCRFISADNFAFIDTYTPMSVNAYVYCKNDPIYYNDIYGYLAAEAAGGAALYYFLNYVLPEIIIYGTVIISGAFIVYELVKAITDSLSNLSSSSNSSGLNNSKKPKKSDNQEKINRIIKEIPNELKKGNKVDLKKFDTKLKNGQGYRAKNGWKIQKDTANHGGREWKLFNKAG